ncbi:Polyadenylate-binding protein [Arachis hypogaea]|nr:Polyadenylate-binding protein [Arachis hypogaea]
MNSPGNGLIISRMLSRLLMKTYLAMTKTEDFDDMDKRLKDIEDETAALKEMQAKVKKEMGSVQALSHLAVKAIFLYTHLNIQTPLSVIDSNLRIDLGTASASQVNREEIDSRSVFVGNEASAIPFAALTAWRDLKSTARITEGQRILVVGGGGAVGFAAI